MADTPRMALLDLLRKAAADPDVDFLREALRVLTQELAGADAGVDGSGSRGAPGRRPV